MQPLQNLNAPVYFIEGNHDEYTGVKAIKEYLKSIGIRVLENEVTHYKELQVVGLTFMVADSSKTSPHANAASGTVESTLNSLKPNANKPTVLLHHGPDGIKYANQHGVDLYLAGHTHGGQLWPATYFAKAMFEYNRGLHNYNGTQVYVSLGTGTFGPPMRVGTYSELTILNLKPNVK
jgi:predicted MPP superfamily phosphohydrolase